MSGARAILSTTADGDGCQLPAPSFRLPAIIIHLMRIAIGADHAGFPLKEHLVATLVRLGHDVDDRGTFTRRRRSTIRRSAPTSRGAVVAGQRGPRASSSAAAARASRSPPTRSAACAPRSATISTPPACRASTTTPTCSPWAGASSRSVSPTRSSPLWLTTPFEGGRHQRRVDQIADESSTRQRRERHGCRQP